MPDLVRQTKLVSAQKAALTKLDRSLEELERCGQQRVRDMIDVVAAEFDLDALKSIVYDVEAALNTYTACKGELRRLK